MAAEDGGEREIEEMMGCKDDGGGREEEVRLIVEFGVRVKDVMIEHGVYGEVR
ncbi:3H domain-containing protein, partial [Bacillus sp. WP8]|uniref:3H domain-containing protein n=1 Tax=Bacillus sp. WP8 TaxID=756828 RepID=UPI0037BEE8A0